MTDIQVIAIVAAILALIVNISVIIFLFKKYLARRDGGETMGLLLQQLNDMQRVMHDRLGESGKMMQDAMQNQSGESQRLVSKFITEITQMTDKVARVEETGKQMVGFADQLRSLQDILKNPKQRGILGEYYLETLLKNVLPPGSFQMQYPFKD